MHETLDWIDENTLINICKDIIKKGTPKSTVLSYKNVVDPFSALFDIAVNNIKVDDWELLETRRQHQKTLQNAIGIFHQKLLGSISGWQDLGRGEKIDLKNNDKKIIAEVKNKYNTVKQSDEIHLYETFDDLLSTDPTLRGFTAYYVQVLSKEGKFDRTFVPSNNKGKKPQENQNIREIDGRSFYALATGSPTALEDLYRILPDILEIATEGNFQASAFRDHPLFSKLIHQFPKGFLF